MTKRFCTKWDSVNNRWLDPPVTDFTGDPGLTVQSPTEEVDINKIMKKVEKGIAIPLFQGEPFYGDVSELGGLQEAIIKAQEATELFMQYPADVREKFDNDPVKLVDFLSDPSNSDKAVALGLAVARPKVEVPVPAPASPAPGS